LYDIPRLLHAISGILETLGDGDFTPEAIQTRLDDIFDAICAEYPGAVTIRHSYGLFKKLGHIDREEMQPMFVQDTPHPLEATPGAHPVTVPTGQVGQQLLITQQRQYPVYEAGHAPRYHGEPDTEKWSRLYANARIPANQSMQLGNTGAPDNGAQYTPATYTTYAQPWSITNEFGGAQSNESNVFPGTVHPYSQAAQQFNIDNKETGSWASDLDIIPSQLAQAQPRVVHVNDAGEMWLSSQNSPRSVPPGDSESPIPRPPRSRALLVRKQILFTCAALERRLTRPIDWRAL
jgi:hypothetical protein